MTKPVSLLEFAYDKLKDQIITGQLCPGFKLSAKAIAEEFKISQTPVKEAINRLVAEGFVQSIPRHGQQVSLLSLQSIQDMLEVRIMMECYAAKFVIANAHRHPDILSRMEQLHDQYDIVTTLDYSFAMKLEQEYHHLYMQLSENSRLIQLYQTDWSIGLVYHLYSVKNYPLSELSGQYASHREMYALIMNGDAKELEIQIERTLRVVFCDLERYFL